MQKLSHSPRAPQSIATEGDGWWFLDTLDHQPEDVEFVFGIEEPWKDFHQDRASTVLGKSTMAAEGTMNGYGESAETLR